jgi:uncharacterized integral membrane protein
MTNPEPILEMPTLETPILFGQFGEYTITPRDRLEVKIYRAGLLVSALSFAIGAGLVLGVGTTPEVLEWLTPLWIAFGVGLGVSLLTIHIYLRPLHRLLQLFWLIGFLASLDVLTQTQTPLVAEIYTHPDRLWSIGCLFAALTGITFKEAFCFDRAETKFLTPIMPITIVGHMAGILPVASEKVLLGIWAVLLLMFASRKLTQNIPDDIGDKSVFEHFKDPEAHPDRFALAKDAASEEETPNRD